LKIEFFENDSLGVVYNPCVRRGMAREVFVRRASRKRNLGGVRNAFDCFAFRVLYSNEGRNGQRGDDYPRTWNHRCTCGLGVDTIRDGINAGSVTASTSELVAHTSTTTDAADAVRGHGSRI
jgi:hypothetical protein